MDVRNCRKCGKVFNYIGGIPICPACKEKQEADFQKAKEYIRTHPDTTVATVAEECEIEVQQIRQWLREERLTFGSIEGSDLVCENCGTKILSGRFCDKCKSEVAKGLTDSIKKPDIAKPLPKKPESTGNKMRFLNS
ncbi:MAG: flagellar protein [Lachnospiraceae bacterium]|nr:flagellar protein [Lachnospiraceae bacterium]